MSNLTNTFIGLIEKGVTAMNAITDPKDKGMLAAELAKAVAATGLIGFMTIAEDGEVTTEEAAETKVAIKEDKPGKVNKPAKPVKPVKPVSDKTEAAATPVAKEEEEPKEPVETDDVVADESTDTEEWTDEAIEKYAAELDYITQVREAYGDEGIEASISDWSEGHYSTFDEITPLNVKGFAAYLEFLVADLEKEAAAE